MTNTIAVPTWGESANAWVTYQKLKEAHPELFRGYQTGWRDFDKLTGGIQKGTSTIIIGESKMGKTGALLTLAINLAEVCKVTYITMEQSTLQLMERGMANVSVTDMNSFRDLTMNATDWDRVIKAVDKFQRKKGGIVYGYRDLSDIQRIVDQEDPDIIILDYVQLMTNNIAQRQNMREMYTVISHYLKNITLPPSVGTGFPELDAITSGSKLRCTISAGQTDKATKQHKGKVTSSSGRETSAWDDDADYICAMNFVYEMTGLNPLPDIRTLDITSRRSASDQIKLRFNAAQALFENWDEPKPTGLVI